MAATAAGISSHSFRATVLTVRKKGHSSVSIRSDVSASAMRQLNSDEASQYLPVDIGVFDDLTTTSATSANGIAFRRPRGGVGSVEAPGDGPENILVV